ncbi:winged helix-turn-helix domain-containing protein [Microbispora sp. NPDC049633]|uniref:winged helix-turn-helix domain-containing protein n=1 Tax=Microbispora sp. NPDC049633 TaxID=3154355 RepID=UPI003413462F
MSIDREAVKAPYLQLADILRERITSGQIPPGRRVPSQMELEQEFEISRNTIKKALDVLKREGLLETAPGRGLFVRASQDAENPPPPTPDEG